MKENNKNHKKEAKEEKKYARSQSVSQFRREEKQKMDK